MPLSVDAACSGCRGRMTLRACLAVSILVLSPVGIPAGESPTPPPKDSGFVRSWVATRLSLGARVTFFWLQDTRRSSNTGFDNANLTGNFLGSLWGLDGKQHYFPNPFLEYRVISSFGVGAAYDQARAKTLDWANQEKLITAGDGDLQIRGLQTYLFGRYRNRSRATPYAQLGWGWYWSEFFESPGWSARRWFRRCTPSSPRSPYRAWTRSGPPSSIPSTSSQRRRPSRQRARASAAWYEARSGSARTASA